MFKEIPYCDPLSIFEQVHQKKWAILLDSAMSQSNYGRYSYIAIEPFCTVWVQNGYTWVDDKIIETHDNPFLLLRSLLKQMTQEHVSHLPPFQGGAAGSFAYDLYHYLEDIPAHGVDPTQFPDMAIGLYDLVISFDAVQKKAWIISTGWPESTASARSLRAQQRLNDFEQWITPCLKTKPTETRHKASATGQEITSNFNQKTYTQAVQSVKDHILAGDIFQANISQCFQGQLPEHGLAFDLYKQLRQINPAPFAAYFNLGDFLVLSASPERFLQLIEGRVETRPIKGTRARSTDLERDRRHADELKHSEKDRAENTMIVDLLRNDLSKVCKQHSIVLSQFCELESYATVHHLVSVVQGELKPNHDAIDLLLAAFPGGSITGAPKIRAMEIIATIEPCKRGIYCGSIGFIGFNGAMDTSIVIRTYLIKNKAVYFQSGGAIVLDSNPQDEYQESVLKSSALHSLLKTM